MISAGCIQKNTEKCIQKNSELTLTDRYQKKFVIKNICNYCYNVIYNVAPLMLADQKKEIDALNPYKIRLQFTMENSEQTEKIINLYGKIFVENIETELPDIEFTRGHFKRGVK